MRNNHGESVNKYTQGTVWYWVNPTSHRSGVQSGDRPILIISNNKFNMHSPVVNCVSITSVLKPSPVHVPVTLLQDSHIQCEQLHTIPKTELNDYIGTVPQSVLASVKEKMLFQLDINEDRSTAFFADIKKSVGEMERIIESTDLKAVHESLNRAHKKLDAINAGADVIVPSGTNATLSVPNSRLLDSIAKGVDALNEKANKGFGLPEVEDALLQMLVDLHSSFTKALNSTPLHLVKSDEIKPVTVNSTPPPPPVAISQETYIPGGTSDTSNPKDLKQVHRKYSDDDKEFIIDGNNSIDDLIERFGFKDKPAAFSARAYIRRTYKGRNKGRD